MFDLQHSWNLHVGLLQVTNTGNCPAELHVGDLRRNETHETTHSCKMHIAYCTEQFSPNIKQCRPTIVTNSRKLGTGSLSVISWKA